MATTVHCPQCSRELRVPDELIGKKVKCPACATTFMASVAPGEAPPPPGPSGYEEAAPRPPRSLAPEEEYDGPAEDYDDDVALGRSRLSRQRALSPLKAPAICLIVTGSLGLIVSLFGLVSAAVTNPQNAKQAFKDLPPQFREAMEKSADFEASAAGVILRLALVVVSIVVIVGAIMMLMGRMYWLAMTASILAMLNPQCCCCLLGIPFGIWSLVVLSKSDVKKAFS